MEDHGATRATALRRVHRVLGVVMIAAGALKLFQLGFETQDESLEAVFLMVFAEVELLAGIWMVSGMEAERIHPWVVAAFAGFAASNLLRAFAGKCSCGCFGGLSIHPGAVLVFDLAAMAALLVWRPPADTETTPLDRPARLVGLVVLAMVIAVMGWQQADVVTITGTATQGGRPSGEATLTFIGESGKRVVRTNHDGHFRLPSVRRGRYAVALSSGNLVPNSRRELPSRVPNRKNDARRSRPTHTHPQKPPGSDLPMAWIEISQCSEQDRTIEFQ